MGEISKTIVCLANSRKHSGRCIAGKELLPTGYGQWIRPVSIRPTGEISEEDRRYKDGGTPKILDIISIRMIAATPLLYQSENYTIDAAFYWEKSGSCAWSDVAQMLDQPPSLWTNGDSSYSGINDRLRVEVAAKLQNSLTIIEPKNLVIRVSAEGAAFGNPKRKVRAYFYNNKVHYALSVTDPVAETAFLAKSDDSYEVSNTYLSVSLGEVYEGSCYKLVAAMISKESL